MSRLSECFPNVEQFCTDVFVADYTQVTNNARKLEFFSAAPTDIQCFHLKNKKTAPILVYAISFEKNPSIFKGNKNCECLLTSEANDKKPWVLLLEMKYCLEKNIDENSEDAYIQLKRTYTLLEAKGIIDTNYMNVYLNISIPDHSQKEPFLSFANTQSDSLTAYKEQGIQILGRNTILIATPNYLFEQKRKV